MRRIKEDYITFALLDHTQCGNGVISSKHLHYVQGGMIFSRYNIVSRNREAREEDVMLREEVAELKEEIATLKQQQVRSKVMKVTVFMSGMAIFVALCAMFK